MSKDRLGDRVSAEELLHDIKFVVREEVMRDGRILDLIAEAFLRGMSRRMGGQARYIPAEDRSARDRAIRMEFDGRNLEDVMARHGVSKSTVYRAVK